VEYCYAYKCVSTQAKHIQSKHEKQYKSFVPQKDHAHQIFFIL
jgi:hypothetical protein